MLNHTPVAHITIAYSNVVATIGDGECRVCDPQSHEPLVMNSTLALDHIDMLTPDTRAVRTEAAARSCDTQRQTVFAVLSNPAAG